MHISVEQYKVFLGQNILFASCPAIHGTVTYKPSRTAQDETIDRNHTLQLGTFSAHSLMRGLVEALESIYQYHRRVSGCEVTNLQFVRTIAQLKMGIASIQYQRMKKLRMYIGRYTGEHTGKCWPPKPMFEGFRCCGVLWGGKLSPAIARWLRNCVTGGRRRQSEGHAETWIVQDRRPVISDAVFAMNLDRNRRLPALHVNGRWKRLGDGSSRVADEFLDLSRVPDEVRHRICYFLG